MNNGEKNNFDIKSEKNSNATPQISIIIPAYNAENYIEKCLKSLINQTLKNIEIIAINDGSFDKTGEIITQIANSDKRIHAIMQKNQGVASTRNNGIKLAKGEYISFVDSDDYVDHDFFEKLYDAAQKNNCDIASASILKHKKNHTRYNLLYKKSLIADSVQSKIKLCRDKKQRFFYVWNKIYRTSLIKDNHISFPDGRIFEDVIFSMKAIYYANKIISVTNTNYHYIENSNSIINSKTKNEKKQQDLITAYSELQDFAKNRNIKLPERLNYYLSCWKNPFIKIYKGKYKQKMTLFGILPVYKKSVNL